MERNEEATIEYRARNSGGDWWLSDDQWRALEAAGWDVDWISDREPGLGGPDETGRWLGALATTARKAVASMRDGIAEWERVTGECSSALGCSCCGPPHAFTFTKGGDWDYWSPSYPEHGESYA